MRPRARRGEGTIAAPADSIGGASDSTRMSAFGRAGPAESRRFARGARLARCTRRMRHLAVIAITVMTTARAWADPVSEPEPDHRVGLTARLGGIFGLAG